MIRCKVVKADSDSDLNDGEGQISIDHSGDVHLNLMNMCGWSRYFTPAEALQIGEALIDLGLQGKAIQETQDKT